MGKRKSAAGEGEGAPASRPGHRTVYREFGPADPLARAVPDRPASQQQLRVQVSRKGRGGKTVTVISGFQHRPDTLSTLAKQMKAHCGSGGTAKEDTIEIQGDHAQKLVDWLSAQGYGVKRSGG